MATFLYLMKIIPKNLSSYFCGRLVSISFPKPVQDIINLMFIKFFKIDITEAEKELKEYSSIQDVFTRKLKNNSRNIAPFFCSPCDGTLNHCGSFTEDTLLQVKGIHYSVSNLLFGEKKPSSESIKSGWYASIYLAPHNYHRVHSPVSGELLEITHITGTLWPVNSYFLKNIPQLYTVNERLIFKLKTEKNTTTYIVMIGAFNVGRIRSLVGTEVITNSTLRTSDGKKHHKITLKDSISVLCGDELGVFMLGSSVVVICDEKLSKIHSLLKRDSKKTIRLGETFIENNESLEI